MQPCFIVIVNSQEHDYTHYVDGEGMQIEKNDIDAEGAGRNILDGKMYRNRLAQKYKVTVKFLPLPSSVVSALSADLSADEFVDIKILDPETDSIITLEVYKSTIQYGIQRYNRGAQDTRYHGCTVSLIER